MLLLFFANVQAKTPEPDPAVLAFVYGYCGPANPPRYAGARSLPPLPAGVRVVPIDPLADGGPVQPTEIGPDGWSESTSRWIVIDATTPTPAVADALAQVSSRLAPAETRWLAFAAPAPSTALREVPLTGGARDRYRALLDAPAPSWPADDDGRCPDLVAATRGLPCAISGALIARALADRRCADRAPDALAWFVRTARPADGVAVAAVAIRAGSADPVRGTRTWGEDAPELVARPSLAMAPPREGAELLPFVDHKALAVQRRDSPAFPESVLDLSAPDYRCVATVSIDEHGLPFDVTVSECPALYHPGTREALLQWRWFPPQIDGMPARVQTSIQIVYKATLRRTATSSRPSRG